MIREGERKTVGEATVSLLTDTQFSTITEAAMFVVRLVGTVVAGAPTYQFRRGSDRLSQGAVSLVAAGIAAAEDAEIFRGMIDPGNLYLDVTGTAATDAVMFDITSY